MSIFLYMNAIKKLEASTIRTNQMEELKTLIAKFGYPQAEKLYDEEEFLNQIERQEQKQSK